MNNTNYFDPRLYSTENTRNQDPWVRYLFVMGGGFSLFFGFVFHRIPMYGG